MRLISFQEGCRQLGIKIPTLYKWIDRGKITAVRLGEGSSKFPKQKLRAEDVEALKPKVTT